MSQKVGRFTVAMCVFFVRISAARSDDGAGSPKPLSSAELAAITERGRELAGYDEAAWHASDAVQTANPKTVEGQQNLAKFEDGKWTVVFGKLSADKSKFLIYYDATQGQRSTQFVVSKREPPVEDRGFYLFAARALENAQRDFVRPARPYNGAVLPAEGNHLYVYLYPAQSKANVYPLGGDMRYLVSGDGNSVVETRALHKGIIETAPLKGKKQVAGFHAHDLSDVPEDTDVLHVLQQNPPHPESIGTAHFTYQIAADGSITVVRKSRK